MAKTARMLLADPGAGSGRIQTHIAGKVDDHHDIADGGKTPEPLVGVIQPNDGGDAYLANGCIVQDNRILPLAVQFGHDMAERRINEVEPPDAPRPKTFFRDPPRAS